MLPPAIEPWILELCANRAFNFNNTSFQQTICNDKIKKNNNCLHIVQCVNWELNAGHIARNYIMIISSK